MKPIEIHIEGYKIVISDDKEPEVTKEKEEDTIKYVPYPVTIPTPNTPQPNDWWWKTPQPDDWWRYPYVTWTCGDMTITNTAKPDIHPVRDTMVGKE